MTGQDRRLSLQTLLENLMGNRNVYFQPPDGLTMQYPCIVYARDNASYKNADNFAYFWKQRYQVTYIAQDPDSDIIDKLMGLQLCAYNRHFATSGLNHDVFVLYH